MRRFVPGVLAALALLACGGSEPAAPSATAGAEKPAIAPRAAPVAAPKAVEANAKVIEPALPERVDAGTLPREGVLAVLKQGAGRFLRKVRTEPHLEDGHFVGWRLVSLFDEQPAMRGDILRPGDTLMRVNGQSIERPEEFLNVWHAMRTSGELVLRIRRAGRESTVRYAIVD